MATEAVYGMKSLKLMQSLKGAYPDFGESAFTVRAIVKDSFSYTDTAPTENNIEIEDSDEYFATIFSDSGKKGFSLQTYDMGKEAYEYLLGYTETEDGYMTDPSGFTLTDQAVQIVTQKLGNFPAKVFEWARMSVKVSRTGTIGKSGFPNFQLEFTKLANLDAQGNEVPGERWKEVEE
jgi:hypothetical protein